MKKLFLIMAVAALLIACNNSGTSSEEKKDTASMSSGMSTEKTKEDRNKQNISEAIKAINADDVNEMSKYFAADVVDHGDGSTPTAKSADSVKSMMQQFVNIFPDMKVDPIVIAADGDYVIVYSNWSGSFKNDAMGIKATGKSFKTKDADIFKMTDDGKIAEHWSIMPMTEIWKGVGAKMPMK
jgi:steroid delta-isomerase-like uncharacterized protein